MGLLKGRAQQHAGTRKYSSYYAGTDIRIYFGDHWVDEIVEIEFSLQEQVAPIFGYASHTWDAIARGNRFVQGSFSINFKEVGYLQTILNSLSSKQTQSGAHINLNTFNKSLPYTDTMGRAQVGMSVDKLVSNFDTLAEDYEKALWGESNKQSGILDDRKNDTFFYNTNSSSKNQTLKDHGFNILITYGQTGDIARGDESHQTAQTIVGVQLNGMSTRVDPSGNPVQEVYSFIAKDLSGDATELY